MRFLFAILACVVPALAANVNISVIDASGAPLKDVLVILQTLERTDRELCRSLTDEQGHACGMELSPGLYRVIGTTPYGLWDTTAVEFLAARSSSQVTFKMNPTPTHGYGDVVTVGSPTIDLEVLQSDGRPASEAEVLVRDREVTLHLERWYKTDRMGKAKIELVGDPTIVVVFFQGMLLSREVVGTDPVTIRLPTGAGP